MGQTQPTPTSGAQSTLRGIGLTVVAAGAGYAAGVLLAPKSGHDTRRAIMRRAARVKDIAKERIAQVRSKMTATVNDVTDKAHDMSQTGQRMLDALQKEAGAENNHAK